MSTWLTWEQINGGDLCPTYLYRFVLANLPGGRRVYLHHFVGDDWSRDPHDHPKWFISVGLWGAYDEDVYSPEIGGDEAVRTKRWRAPWIRKFPAEHIHRVRARHTGGAWTLVVTGPVTREWGFWYRRTWVAFREYLSAHGDARKDC